MGIIFKLKKSFLPVKIDFKLLRRINEKDTFSHKIPIMKALNFYEPFNNHGGLNKN